VEMCRFLIHEEARWRVAVFSRTKSLKSFLDDRRDFAMVVSVRLDVRRTDVHLAAAVLPSESKVCNENDTLYLLVIVMYTYKICNVLKEAPKCAILIDC